MTVANANPFVMANFLAACSKWASIFSLPACELGNGSPRQIQNFKNWKSPQNSRRQPPPPYNKARLHRDNKRWAIMRPQWKRYCCLLLYTPKIWGSVERRQAQRQLEEKSRELIDCLMVDIGGDKNRTNQQAFHHLWRSRKTLKLLGHQSHRDQSNIRLDIQE